MTISQLPDVLLTHTFSFLGWESISEVSQVSKRWHQIAMNDRFWQQLAKDLGFYCCHSQASIDQARTVGMTWRAFVLREMLGVSIRFDALSTEPGKPLSQSPGYRKKFTSIHARMRSFKQEGLDKAHHELVFKTILTSKPDATFLYTIRNSGIKLDNNQLTKVAKEVSTDTLIELVTCGEIGSKILLEALRQRAETHLAEGSLESITAMLPYLQVNEDTVIAVLARKNQDSIIPILQLLYKKKNIKFELQHLAHANIHNSTDVRNYLASRNPKLLVPHQEMLTAIISFEPSQLKNYLDQKKLSDECLLEYSLKALYYCEPKVVYEKIFILLTKLQNEDKSVLLIEQLKSGREPELAQALIAQGALPDKALLEYAFKNHPPSLIQPLIRSLQDRGVDLESEELSFENLMFAALENPSNAYLGLINNILALGKKAKDGLFIGTLWFQWLLEKPDLKSKAPMIIKQLIKAEITFHPRSVALAIDANQLAFAYSLAKQANLYPGMVELYVTLKRTKQPLFETSWFEKILKQEFDESQAKLLVKQLHEMGVKFSRGDLLSARHANQRFLAEALEPMIVKPERPPFRVSRKLESYELKAKIMRLASCTLSALSLCFIGITMGSGIAFATVLAIGLLVSALLFRKLHLREDVCLS